MNRTDCLTDVLGPVRDIHVAALLDAVARELADGAEVDAEPVDRDDDGRILRRAPLSLPRRRDLRVLRGGVWTLRRAPSAGPIAFAPVTVDIGAVRAARVAPFAWGAAAVRVRRGRAAPDWRPLRRWFLEWFQARFGEESPDLLGVAHDIDGPVDDHGGWRFTVDLGSASVAGFEGMLRAFADTGCADIRVGETEAAL